MPQDYTYFIKRPGLDDLHIRSRAEIKVGDKLMHARWGWEVGQVTEIKGPELKVKPHDREPYVPVVFRSCGWPGEDENEQQD